MSIILFQFNGCNNNTISSGKEIVLRLEPSDGNPRNSEGDFITLKNDRILFIYTHFTEGSGDNAHAYLASRYSDDDGRTWTEEDIAIVQNEGGMNIMSVSLIRLSSNQIALFYLIKNSETDCLPVMRISSDEANTWGKPIICVDEPGYYVMNNDRIVILKNGRIILPLSLHNTPDINEWFNGRIICYYSDDDGNSWNKGNEVDNSTNITSQEPGLIELDNGKVMLFCRSDVGVQYISYSNDDCVSWSELEPSNIKSPLSPASIERIPQTNDLLLVWNNSYKEGKNGGNRTPFNLAISKDEGINWDKIKSIESDPNGWYCYTAIEFVDEHLLLGHCAGNRSIYNGLETTQITRINLDWIYNEATIEPYIKASNSGTVEVACEDKNAIIYYTVDGNYESLNPGNIYNKSISVKKISSLLMYAVSNGKTKSEIVSSNIGDDIFIDSMKDLITNGAGLEYKYHEGEFVTTSEIEKTNVVKSGIVENFDILKSANENNFGYIFNGFLEIEKDGYYTFYIDSNDGSTFFLNDKMIVANDGAHSSYEKSTSISLRKGKHKIMLKYFQTGGGKELNVYWSGKGFAKMEIPESVLSH